MPKQVAVVNGSTNTRRQPKGSVVETGAKEGLPDESFFERIPIKELNVDKTYQREPSELKLNALRKAFNEDALFAIAVSMRDDGTYWIVDGQGRAKVAGEVLGLDYAIPAYVYIDLTPEQEAQMFDFLNGTRWNRQTSALQQFKAQLAAKDPAALAVKLAASKAGFSIPDQPAGHQRPYTLTCVSSLLKVAEEIGIDELERALRILAAAYDGDHESCHRDLVVGLGAFLARYSGVVDDRRLAEKLGAVPALQLRRDGANYRLGITGAGSVATAMGRAMLAFYNKGLRTGRLDPWDVATSVRHSRIRQKSK